MFYIHFWGVRGSRCTPFKNYMKYGGNTSCVEIVIDNSHFIFDAGTGFTTLGKSITKDDDIHVFFSHYHHDHINGLCFFEPYFKDFVINFYGSCHDKVSVRDMFEHNFDSPYFPITPRIFKAKLKFHDISNNDKLEFLDKKVIISTFPVVHPNDCICYKIEYESKKIIICTDTDIFPKEHLKKFMDFIYGADILIFDGTTVDEDYMFGWGHSSISEAIYIFEMSNIKKMILTHHDSMYTDSYLDNVKEKLKLINKNISLSYENMHIDLDSDIIRE